MKLILVPNNLKYEAVQFAGSIARELMGEGHTCFCLPEAAAGLGAVCPGILTVNGGLEGESEGVIAVTVGGDGTMLRAIRTLNWPAFPFWGINFGHLGYLTGGEPAEAMTLLHEVLSGNAVTEKRMLLTGSLRQNGSVTDFIGLNEAVLSRGAVSRALKLSLSIGGSLLQEYYADGIIVATPTGSTAYNLSAGGPVLMPESKHLAVTSLCPQGFAVRSLVVAGSEKVGISASYHTERGETAQLVIDGCESLPVECGAEISIKDEGKSVKLLRTGSGSFIEVFRHKIAALDTLE